MKRNFMIDNTKGILIFLVVLGHFLEFNVTSKTGVILNVIYSFHMPVFVFLSGYLAKYDSKKMFKKILLPYVVFQIIAFLFYNLFEPTKFTLVAPYHSLWYMLALFFWYMLIPFLDNVKFPKIALMLFLLLGLLIGFDIHATTILSVSRIFVFLPFFALGYFVKKYNWDFKFHNTGLKCMLVLVLVIINILMFKYRNEIVVQWFYGYAGYEQLYFNPGIRFLIYAVAFLWILFFINFIPNKITFLSKIGRNSLCVYLPHYMIVYAINYFGLLKINNHPTVMCFIYAAFLTFILSRDFIKKLFTKC